MTAYVFKIVRPGRVSVSKMTELGDEPSEVYFINHGYCTCPSYKQPCKHRKWLDRWKVLKCPANMYFDDRQDEFTKNTLFDDFAATMGEFINEDGDEGETKDDQVK